MDAKFDIIIRRITCSLLVHTQMPYDKVSEALNALFELKREQETKETKDALMELWDEISIPAEDYERKLSELSLAERRLMLLSGICVLQRPIALLDEPSLWLDEEQLAKAGACIRQMARNGATVIVTCQEHDPVLRYCDKLVEINGHSYHN